MQPNFVINKAEAIRNRDEQERDIKSLLSKGESTIAQSRIGNIAPFRSYRLDMLNNSTVNSPIKIGPHKSLLFRNIVTGTPGAETVQTYTPNDVLYYSNKKEADPSLWVALQVGKSIEFDEPVDGAYIWIPNVERNPTFALIETTVLGYFRSYQAQQANLGSVQPQDGSAIIPNAAVAVDDTAGGTLIAASSSVPRCLTLYNQGASTVWLGGNSAFPPIVNTGVPLASGEKVTIRNTAEIRGICDTGLTASVSYTEEF